MQRRNVTCYHVTQRRNVICCNVTLFLLIFYCFFKTFQLKNVKVVQLEVLTTEQETPIETVQHAIAMLQAYPVQVVFTAGGQVKMIRVGANDPEWCRNFKRGIVNMLQIAPKVAGKDPKQILTSQTPVVIVQKEVRTFIDCYPTKLVIIDRTLNSVSIVLQMTCSTT
jgi:hypothetical protein